MNHSFKIIMGFFLLFFAASCTAVKPTTSVEPATAPTIPGPTETPAPIPTLATPPTAIITEVLEASPTPENIAAPILETDTPEQINLPPGSRPRIIPIENTNCHIRPGKDPNIVGYFLKGMESEVFGKDPTGDWVLIPNPNRVGEFCWVWTGSTQIIGEMDTVLVIP